MNSFIQKSFQWFSIKLFYNLFIVWFILIPFDAQLLPLDLGVITIYPELILTFFLLFGCFILRENKEYSREANLFQLFYLVWCVYAVCYYPFLNGKYEALHEIRSLVLMGATITVIIRASLIIGKEKFKELIHKLSYILFIFLVIIGFIEFFTGIHFEGLFTDKIINLIPGPVTYAPVFLYDNPNNFLVYLFSFSCIHLLTKQKINTYQLFSMLLLLLFFSIAGDSKFGKITTSLLFIIYFFPKIWEMFRRMDKIWVRSTILLGACFIVSLFFKPLFFGPMWKDNPNYLLAQLTPIIINENKVTFIDKDSLVEVIGKDALHKSFVEYRAKHIVYSTELRKNLIYNGVYLTKESNYLGVGPGQFQYYHTHNLVPYATNKISNPHESNLEIASQYGIIILLLFVLFMLQRIYITLKSSLELKQKSRYLAICISYLIVSEMPSSWMVLNIAWVFTAILFVFPDLILTQGDDLSE